MSDKIVIVATGLTTSVGLTSRQTTAAILGDVAKMRTVDLLDKTSHPITMAVLPEDVLDELPEKIEEITQLSHHLKRMLKIAGLALDDLKNDEIQATAALFLGLPEVDDIEPGVMKLIVDFCAQKSGLSLSAEQMQLSTIGRTGGLSALSDGINALKRKESEFALVGGVDSFYDAQVLHQLDQANRILSYETAYGFQPGEGAGFLLICTEETADRYELTALGHIAAVGEGFEPGHFGSRHPWTGEGLKECWKHLFENANPDHFPIKSVISPLNGERQWSREYGTALLNQKKYIDPDYEMLLPVVNFGDIGAAIGPAMIILAIYLMHKEHIKSPALIYCGSDSGERAATILTN